MASSRPRVRSCLFVVPVLSLVGLSGCEEHELTRPATGNTAYRWSLVWIAASLLCGLITYMVVQRFQKHGGWRRSIGGGAWILAAAALVVVQYGGWAAVSVRASQLEREFGGCREVPYEQRPPSLMQITCQEDNVDFDLGGLGLILLAFALFVYLLALAIPLLIGMMALRTRPGLVWIPGVAAFLAAMATSAGAAEAVGGHRVLLWVLTLCAAGSAACLAGEWFSAQRRLRAYPGVSS